MTSTTIETPPKKKKLEIATWIAIVSVVIALASAVVAILAAIFSHQQANAANQQNTINEQQQLLTLTTTIAQQLDQAQPSTSNGQIAWTETLTLNGEAAQVVITKLGGDGVTGVEYDEVARALGTGVDPAKAIAYYQDAVNAPPHDPGTRAEALRGEAALYYQLGQPGAGHYDYMQAVEVYSGNLEMQPFIKGNNIAQSYLVDAQNELNINSCTIASTDITAAKKALSGAGGQNATNGLLLASDIAAYNKQCVSSSTASPASTH